MAQEDGDAQTDVIVEPSEVLQLSLGQDLVVDEEQADTFDR